MKFQMIRQCFFSLFNEIKGNKVNSNFIKKNNLNYLSVSAFLIVLKFERAMQGPVLKQLKLDVLR